MNFDKYCVLLLEANGVNAPGVSPFIISDGMGLGDDAVWWDSSWDKRPVPHEGIDLVRFKTSSGVVSVFRGFRIISPVSGTVVGISPDFLDKTVWLNPDGRPDVVVVLAHLAPQVTLGQRLVCGDAVGLIDYKVRGVPLHLHVSMLTGAWRSIPVLDWRGVHAQQVAHFVQPSF